MGGAESAWRSMRHGDFQDWAERKLGDARHVYARDKRLPLDAPLVHMPDGEADRFREDAHAEYLVCPVPGCPAWKLTTRHSEIKRDHFAHWPDSGVSGHAEYEEVVVGKLLSHWVTNQPGVELIEHEPEPDSPITLLTRLASGQELAICYVTKRMGVDAWIQHRCDLERKGIASAWILSRSRYLSLAEAQPPPPPEGDDGDEGEFASLLVRDKALFKMMRRCGCWPLLINMEGQELVNLLVPGYATAKRLGLQSRYAEGVLHAVASPLESCGICEDGIECKPIVYAGSLKKIRQGGEETLWQEHRKRGGLRGSALADADPADDEEIASPPARVKSGPSLALASQETERLVAQLHDLDLPEQVKAAVEQFLSQGANAVRIDAVQAAPGLPPHENTYWLVMHLCYFKYAETSEVDDQPEPDWDERWDNAELLHAALREMWPSTLVRMQLAFSNQEPVYGSTVYKARSGEPPCTLVAECPGEENQSADESGVVDSTASEAGQGPNLKFAAQEAERLIEKLYKSDLPESAKPAVERFLRHDESAVRIYSLYVVPGVPPGPDADWLILPLRYFRYAGASSEASHPSWDERWSNAELLRAALLEIWPSTKVKMKLAIADQEPIYHWIDYQARSDEPPNSLAARWPGEESQSTDADKTSAETTLAFRLGRWLNKRLQ